MKAHSNRPSNSYPLSLKQRFSSLTAYTEYERGNSTPCSVTIRDARSGETPLIAEHCRSPNWDEPLPFGRVFCSITTRLVLPTLLRLALIIFRPCCQPHTIVRLRNRFLVRMLAGPHPLRKPPKVLSVVGLQVGHTVRKSLMGSTVAGKECYRNTAYLPTGRRVGHAASHSEVAQPKSITRVQKEHLLQSVKNKEIIF